MALLVKINDRFKNRVIRFFNQIRITSRFDSIGSTFQIDYYFDPNNPEHKEFSCVGHFHLITIEDSFESKMDRMLTGYITTQVFRDEPDKTLAAISGYSLPGILNDCQAPPESFKVVKGETLLDQLNDSIAKKFSGVSLQVDGLTIEEIVNRLVTPFKIKYVIESTASSIMKEVISDAKLSPSQSIVSHLTEICSQKGIIIGNDFDGRLVFSKPQKTRAITHFKRGDEGVLSWQTSFSGQGMHSHIWAMAQQDDEVSNAAESDAIENPLVPIVFRPHVVIQTSGSDTDSNRVALNALREELKNLQITLNINSWRIAGKIVKPGQVISITNPNIYIYKKTDFVIDTVEYTANETEQVATLTCVPPEVYFDSENVISPFQGINLHA